LENGGSDELIGHSLVSRKLRDACAIRTMAAECVDGPRSSRDFTAVHHAARDYEFFARIHRNAFPINDQGVTSLDNDHVFVEIVDVRRRGCGFVACPKRHLAGVGSVEDVTFDPGSRLL
jgi:hypothetical protein